MSEGSWRDDPSYRIVFGIVHLRPSAAFTPRQSVKDAASVFQHGTASHSSRSDPLPSARSSLRRTFSLFFISTLFSRINRRKYVLKYEPGNRTFLGPLGHTVSRQSLPTICRTSKHH